MLPVFTKPLELVTPADVVDLTAQAWPEGYEVEFKKALPHKKGGTHPWAVGADDIGEHARDEILSEVVAFANAQGGSLVLGVEETKDRPPRALAISAVPRVGELARRFEDQARSCIDPPLPGLRIRAVETDGNSGVVIFRTTASRAAPHRLTTTLHSYVRHGSSTLRMTMREIQDMTLNVVRGLAGVEQTFADRGGSFRAWLDRQCSAVGGQVGAALRITAVPLAPLPDPGRILGREYDLFFLQREFAAMVNGQPVTLSLPVRLDRERPIVRGAARVYADQGPTGGRLRQELYQSGLADLWFAMIRSDNRPLIFVSNVLAAAATTLKLINRFRETVGSPDAEYAVEVAIDSIGNLPGAHVPISLVGPLMDPDQTPPNVGTPLLFPRASIGNPSAFPLLLNTILADCHDAIGVRFSKPAELVIAM
jgi:schlafen family protein